MSTKRTNKRGPQPKVADDRDTFIHATRVLDAAQFLVQAATRDCILIEPSPTRKSRGNTDFIVPSQFLITFALELHLKCLVAMRGKDPAKIHELKKLFDDLPQKDKTAARKYFSEYAKKDHDIQQVKNLFGDELNLDLVLDRCETVFQTFRYWHQFKKGDMLPPLAPNNKTRGTLGIHIAFQAIRRVILESPESKNWKDQAKNLKKIAAAKSPNSGVRSWMWTGSGGFLDYPVPKDKSRPKWY